MKNRLAKSLRLRSLPALVLGLLLSLPLTSQAQDRQVVDLELALLVDVSASVDSEEFRLQAKGMAAALRSPEVLSAIRSLTRRGLAIAVIQWSDEKNQRLAVPWAHLRNENDTLWFAAQVELMPRLIHGGHTSLSSALFFAAQEIETNRFDGLRRVIDLAGDGRNNAGLPLRTVRREVLAQGITINGLAILSELPFLDRYFRDHLIGGDGAFYLVTQDYHSFAKAILQKIEMEIRATPLG